MVQPRQTFPCPNMTSLKVIRTSHALSFLFSTVLEDTSMGACCRDITGGTDTGLKSHCCVLEGTVGLDTAELHSVLYGPCGSGAVQAQSYAPPDPSLLLPWRTVPWLVPVHARLAAHSSWLCAPPCMVPTASLQSCSTLETGRASGDGLVQPPA